MKFTGLDIICVLDSNEFIFQGTGKILKKKKENYYCKMHQPYFYFWHYPSFL